LQIFEQLDVMPIEQTLHFGEVCFVTADSQAILFSLD
jgi:hypothetical protein